MPADKDLTASVECGIAGSAKESARFGRLETLQLGGFQVSSPLTVFYERSAERWYDGLLGTPALLRFKVTLDCSGKRLILEE